MSYTRIPIADTFYYAATDEATFSAALSAILSPNSNHTSPTPSDNNHRAATKGFILFEKKDSQSLNPAARGMQVLVAVDMTQWPYQAWCKEATGRPVPAGIKNMIADKLWEMAKKNNHVQGDRPQEDGIVIHDHFKLIRDALVVETIAGGPQSNEVDRTLVNSHHQLLDAIQKNSWNNVNQKSVNKITPVVMKASSPVPKQVNFISSLAGSFFGKKSSQPGKQKTPAASNVSPDPDKTNKSGPGIS